MNDATQPVSSTDTLPLEERYQQLVELNHRKDVCFALVAHELRNVIAPLHSGIHLLKDKRLSVQEFLPVLEDQVSLMMRLIDDLLDAGKTACGNLALKKSSQSLQAIINKSVAGMKPLLAKKRQNVQVSLGDDDVVLEADGQRLVQALSNIIGNAAKYSGDGSSIKICVTVNNHEAMISIVDDGIGINPDEIPHIFDLFTRTAFSQASGAKGMGLGLALVKKIVESHDGRVRAFSEGEDKGTRFDVVLPLRSRRPFFVSTGHHVQAVQRE